MPITTAIYDMDGLIIDSEPLWYEAALESLNPFGIHIGHEEYYQSTGLRTKEFLQYWFNRFDVDLQHADAVEQDITHRVIEKVSTKGNPLPGVESSIRLAQQMGLKIGLASSSPLSLIQAVLEKTKLGRYFSATASAEHLPLGKPHPEVFLNCATALSSLPGECICLEDSLNGLIAAKSARMKCIVVPHPDQRNNSKWALADLQLNSLEELNTAQLHALIT